MNMSKKNIENFPKKKNTKSNNMLAKDKEIFLKIFTFLWMYKNYFRLKSAVFLAKNVLILSSNFDFTL